jgi:hypothetical protein
MGYSIELYFESEFEKKVRSLWDELEGAGVPSIMQNIGSRPHLSLLILDKCNVQHLAGIIEQEIREYCKIPITFPAISVIPGRQQTVCLTPIVTFEMVAIQKGLFMLLDELGYSVRKHYEPNNWLPHCSISKELSASDMLKTLDICQKYFTSEKTWTTDAGFVEFRPRKVIKTIELREST